MHRNEHPGPGAPAAWPTAPAGYGSAALEPAGPCRALPLWSTIYDDLERAHVDSGGRLSKGGFRAAPIAQVAAARRVGGVGWKAQEGRCGVPFNSNGTSQENPP